MEPRFFATREELRAWFEANATSSTELWIGYFKKGTGRPGLRYDVAVIEALSFGWIDGQVRRIDEKSYTNRFTPRGAKSTWSLLNVRRARRLIREGRMRPPGLASFRERTAERTGVYNYERPVPSVVALDAASRKTFATHPRGQAFFERQPPGYRRTMVRWIMSARRPETRAKRLMAVIASSDSGRRVDPLRPYSTR